MTESEEQPFKVVVVDDDRAIRRLVKLFLQRQGYETAECANGAEARDELWHRRWDLAILDRRLPDTDGLQLCREIKGEYEFRNRYVIVLTGEDDHEDKLEGFELGADDYVTKPFQPAELVARIRAARRIVDLQKELLEKNEKLARLSITDGLTQLFNHRHLQESLAREFEEARRYQSPLSFALIDLDFFKKVNDTFGHAAGDEVLKEVASRFSDSVRSSDLVARYGGEEFAVLMPQTSLEDAIQFAEKIRNVVEEEPIQTEETEIRVTVSIGVASNSLTDFDSTLELVDSADKALYRAKENGRNQVQWERRSEPRRTTHPVS